MSLKFIALSGTVSVTENLYVYEADGKMMIIDCGVGFPDLEMHGVDLVIPDFSYIVKNKEKLAGIVISQGHEDHIGALPFLLREVNTQIWAAPLVTEFIKDKCVLVIEDGPTLTHGGMSYGAGILAAEKYGAREIIDPRPYAIGTIDETFKKYTHIGKLLPAMGYGHLQMEELRETIHRIPCDLVIIGTPIDLRKVIRIDKPTDRVRYDLQEISTPTLEKLIEMKLRRSELVL